MAGRRPLPSRFRVQPAQVGTHPGGSGVPGSMRLLAVLVALLAAGCLSDDGSGSSIRVPPRTAAPVAARYPLLAPDQTVVRECLSLRTERFPVLCPTGLPRPLSSHIRPGLYVLTYTRLRHRFAALLVMYGAPHRNLSSRDTPRVFLHAEFFSARSMRALLDGIGVFGLSGSNHLQTLVRVRTLGGHTGRLYRGLRYDRGGGELGGHLTFAWRGDGFHAVSLHAWRPGRETLAVLSALVASDR
jgi:hypothetical protein